MVAARFPGISQVVDCSYTLSHGIAPGVATLSVAPQATWPARVGTLTLEDGNGGEVSFPEMIVDSASFTFNSAGEIVRLNLLDRRWKWRYGHVSGFYNLREREEVIDQSTIATPQQLATLLLRAMGERNFNVGLLPNDTNPEVGWDFDNPAQQLATLAERLGCRVVLQLDNRVGLWPQGQGAGLPTLPTVLSDSPSINLPERPDSIMVVGGPTRFQIDVLLEAVGLDRGDVPVKLDDLSYKPTGGWERSDPPYFNCIADPRDRELAQASVFRWYRIPVFPMGVDGKPLEVPGFGKINSRIEILPIESERVQRHRTTDEFGQPKYINRQAMVWGFFRKPGDRGIAMNLDPVNNKAPDSVLPDPEPDEPPFDLDQAPRTGRGAKADGYSIDTAEGIVKFNGPMFFFASAAWIAANHLQLLVPTHGVRPAILGLRVATSIRDLKTREPVRYTREVKLPGQRFGTGPRVLRHNEIVQVFEPQGYSPNTLKAHQFQTNLTTKAGWLGIQEEANHYIEAAAKEYQAPGARMASYGGIVPIDPNGRIVQVQWQVAGSGAGTTASESDEFSLITMPYNERRFYERRQQAREEEMYWQNVKKQAGLDTKEDQKKQGGTR